MAICETYSDDISDCANKLSFVKPSFLPVHYPYRCTSEAAEDCVLKQSEDDDEDWLLITAGEDTSFGGFDHTTLSGGIYV